jgi:S1-C subfamily serine protease
VTARAVPATVSLDVQLLYSQGEAVGSGIVLTSSGLVLTDEHVTFQADSITAQVGGRGRVYHAAIVGADPADDAALIQLTDASGLTTAVFGNASTAHVGDVVMGIGYPDQALVRARGRITSLSTSVSVKPDGDLAGGHYTNMLESGLDTKSGMSGGPVVDSAGRVVGVIESGDGPTTDAVRADVALGIAKQIAAGQAGSRIVIGLPTILGAAAEDATDDSGYPSGARITRVHVNTPAQAVGIHYKDTVTKLGATTITTALDLELALVPHRPGDRVTISWSDTLGIHHHGTVALARGPGP